MKRSLTAVTIFLLAFPLAACLRGQPSEQPPLHLVFDMDDQPKFQAYEKNDFFPNQSAMREPVKGTISRSNFETEVARSAVNPLPLTRANLERGQEQYNIYCTPCHGLVGDGNGIVSIRGVKLGYIAAASFHTDALRSQADGHFYDVIKNGIRNMGPYGSRISVSDRWAIVYYVRALQRSQNASAKDIPETILSDLKEMR